jgi:DNA topoisomerase-1
VLRDFWRDFIAAVDDIKDLRISQVLDALDEILGPHIFPHREDGGDPRQCPQCGNGRLGLKTGKFGAFVGCSNYPDCRYTRPLADTGGVGGTKVLGTDPATGLEVTLRGGRFGPYVQLGEGAEGEKPKRAGLPKGTSLDAVDLEFALGLLSLPREVGKHPESGEPIVAGIGRYGPYVKHESTYANLEADDDVMHVGLNRAVTLLAEKAARGSKGRRGRPRGKVLGEHPGGGPVTLHEGRYGPYVSHNKVNATLPSELDPASVTLEQAIALVDARAAKGGNGKPKKAAKKKAEAGEKKPRVRKKKAAAETAGDAPESAPASGSEPKTNHTQD